MLLRTFTIYHFKHHDIGSLVSWSRSFKSITCIWSCWNVARTDLYFNTGGTGLIAVAWVWTLLSVALVIRCSSYMMSGCSVDFLHCEVAEVGWFLGFSLYWIFEKLPSKERLVFCYDIVFCTSYGLKASWVLPVHLLTRGICVFRLYEYGLQHLYIVWRSTKLPSPNQL